MLKILWPLAVFIVWNLIGADCTVIFVVKFESSLNFFVLPYCSKYEPSLNLARFETLLRKPRFGREISPEIIWPLHFGKENLKNRVDPNLLKIPPKVLRERSYIM
jgi:hypothetical protein